MKLPLVPVRDKKISTCKTNYVTIAMCILKYAIPHILREVE